MKLQMKKQRAAVQPFPTVSFHLLSATKDRMPVLPQDLQAGELTSVESGFYGEDEDDEPKAEEKSEDVLDLDESTEGETVVSDETEE